jgi:hypothetical protein
LVIPPLPLGLPLSLLFFPDPFPVRALRCRWTTAFAAHDGDDDVERAVVVVGCKYKRDDLEEVEERSLDTVRLMFGCLDY